MEKIQLLKKITQKKYLPILIFAVLQLVYHVFVREPEGSDATWFFQYQLDAFDLRTYLSMRYHTWTSRIVIETILVYLSKHFLLWKILDWAAWMLLAWAMVQLFPRKERERASWLVMGLLLIYPLADLATAGWIATSLNYSWALLFGIVALSGIARVIYQEHTPLWLGGLYAMAAVYGANMEQMCAVMLAVFAYAIITFMVQKRSLRNYWSVLLCFFISAAQFLFIMSCPGNTARKTQEIVNCMPNFQSMTLVDKLSMGFVDTMQHILNSGNILFILFTVILSTFVFLKSKNLFFRFLSLIPIVWNTILAFFHGMFEEEFPLLAQIFKANPIIDGSNYEKEISYIPIAVYLLILWCILVSLVIVCDTWFELCSQAYLFILGLSSRVVLGFSPSIYASQERTFLYFYMAIGLSGIWILIKNLDLLKQHEKLFEGLKLASACALLFAVINSLAAVGLQ